MSNLKALEKKWIENFSKSPLVDRAQEAVNPQFAFEFFYGKSAESTCPDNFLFDFNSYYNNHTSLDIPAVLDKCLEFLGFIGIQLNSDRLKEFIKNNPTEYKNFVDKCYYILKTIGRYGKTLTLASPFKETFREIDSLHKNPQER